MVSEAEKRAQRYYQSCLDINETMEALGGKPLIELLTQIGGWPAIEPSNPEAEKRWIFQEALQTAHNVMNMGGFFTWAVAEDDKNSSRHIIQVNINKIPKRGDRIESFVFLIYNRWIRVD